MTPILHNITMHTCPICIIHGSNFIISLKYKLGILDNNFSGFSHPMVNVFCHFLANRVRPFFFRDRSKFQELKQKQEIFIIYHGLTFTQQAENDGKLDKLSFFSQCLTKINLLKDNYCRQLNICNFIFACPHFGSIYIYYKGFSSFLHASI